MEWPFVYVVKAIYEYEGEELLGIFFEREKAQKVFDESDHDTTKLIRWDALKGEPLALIQEKHYQMKM